MICFIHLNHLIISLGRCLEVALRLSGSLCRTLYLHRLLHLLLFLRLFLNLLLSHALLLLIRLLKFLGERWISCNKCLEVSLDLFEFPEFLSCGRPVSLTQHFDLLL